MQGQQNIKKKKKRERFSQYSKSKFSPSQHEFIKCLSTTASYVTYCTFISPMVFFSATSWFRLFWLQHRCWSDSKRTTATKMKTCRRTAGYITCFHCYSADRIFRGHLYVDLSSSYEMSSRCHSDYSWGHSLSTVSLTTCAVRSGT